MMDGYYGHGGSGYDVVGFLFMLLMMALVVVGIVVVARHLSHGPTNHHEDEALTMLKKRFANGEIDKKEFEEKRKVLSE